MRPWSGPSGVRRLRPFPTLCQDTLEHNPQILAQLLAGPEGGAGEVPDLKEWQILTKHDVWLPRRRQQERARTLLADCQVHVDVALKHQDAREAERWQRLMHDIEVEAGLKGPNAPTEEELEDEAVQRKVFRLFDLQRQEADLERFEDFKLENFIDSSESSEEVQEDEEQGEDEQEDEDSLDQVLDVGQDRRAAVMESAARMLQNKSSVLGGRELAHEQAHVSSKTFDLNPCLLSHEFMGGKQQETFLLEQARDRTLLLQQVCVRVFACCVYMCACRKEFVWCACMTHRMASSEG